MYNWPDFSDEYGDYLFYVDENESLSECIEQVLSLKAEERMKFGAIYVVMKKGNKHRFPEYLNLW